MDFHARYLDGAEELVRVCADPSEAETADRELRALAGAASEHPRATRRLLALNRDQALAVAAPGIMVEPASEWLLTPPE